MSKEIIIAKGKFSVVDFVGADLVHCQIKPSDTVRVDLKIINGKEGTLVFREKEDGDGCGE